jgi:hypothetical protein
MACNRDIFTFFYPFAACQYFTEVCDFFLHSVHSLSISQSYMETETLKCASCIIQYCNRNTIQYVFDMFTELKIRVCYATVLYF